MKKLILPLLALQLTSVPVLAQETLTEEQREAQRAETRAEVRESVKKAAELVAASVKQTLREAQVSQKLSFVDGLAAVAINGRAEGVALSDQLTQQDYGTYAIDLDVNVASDEAFLTINEILAEFLRVNLNIAKNEAFNMAARVGGYQYQRYERGSEFYGVHNLMIAGVKVDVALDLGEDGKIKLLISNQSDIGFDYSSRGQGAWGQGLSLNINQSIALEIANWTISYLIDAKATSYEDSQTGIGHYNNAFRLEYQFNDRHSAYGEFGFGSAQRPELSLGVRIKLDNKKRKR